MLDLIERIHGMEAAPTITHDTSGAAPDTFENERFYVYPDADQAIVGAESGPPRQERFRLRAVYVASAWGEEAQQERSADVTDVLSSKRDEYLTWIAQRESTDLWDHADGSADMEFMTNFTGRAVAILITGFRFLN